MYTVIVDGIILCFILCCYRSLIISHFACTILVLSTKSVVAMCTACLEILSLIVPGKFLVLYYWYFYSYNTIYLFFYYVSVLISLLMLLLQHPSFILSSFVNCVSTENVSAFLFELFCSFKREADV